MLLFLILSTAFSMAQVSPDSLVLYLPFDGNANDYSGNNNHGTSHGVVSDTNRLGQMLSSFRFNGVDSYVSIPASPSMNLIQKSNKVTISAWIDIFQWHGSGNVFSIFERYDPATDAGWQFEANWVPGGFLFLANATTPTWVGCATATPFHQWMHVAVTYDKTAEKVKFYVNGLMVCDKIYSQNINIGDTTTSFAIGRSLSGPDEFSDGLMDDIKVFCRVLSHDEIQVITAKKPVQFARTNGFHISTTPGGPSGIIFEEGQKPSEIRIVDVQGQLIERYPISPSDKRIPLRPLPGGLYLVQADGFPTKKWVSAE